MKKNTKRKKHVKPIAVLDLTNVASAEDLTNRIEEFKEQHNILVVADFYEAKPKRQCWLSRMWSNIKAFFKTVLFLN